MSTLFAILEIMMRPMCIVIHLNQSKIGMHTKNMGQEVVCGKMDLASGYVQIISLNHQLMQFYLMYIF